MEGEALQIGVWGGEGLNRQTEQLCAVGFQILFIMKECRVENGIGVVWFC